VCRRPRADTAEGAPLSLRPGRNITALLPHQVGEQLDLPTAGYVNPVCGVLGGRFLPATMSARPRGQRIFRVRSKYTITKCGGAPGAELQQQHSTWTARGSGTATPASSTSHATGVYDTYQTCRRMPLIPPSAACTPPSSIATQRFYERSAVIGPLTGSGGTDSGRPSRAVRSNSRSIWTGARQKFVQECSNG